MMILMNGTGQRLIFQPQVEGPNFNKLQAPSLTVTEG
jgi:hypothetical protein